MWKRMKRIWNDPYEASMEDWWYFKGTLDCIVVSSLLLSVLLFACIINLLLSVFDFSTVFLSMIVFALLDVAVIVGVSVTIEDAQQFKPPREKKESAKQPTSSNTNSRRSSKSTRKSYTQRQRNNDMFGGMF